MKISTFDLRFVGVTTGIMLARKQVELELHQLQRTEGDVRELVLTDLRVSGLDHDQDELNIAFSEIYFLEEHLPRLRRVQMLIPIHAAYEFGVVQLGRYCTRHLAPQRELHGGGGFLQKAHEFFRDVAGVPLCTAKERTALDMLFKLRHAVAHATGDIGGIRKQDRPAIDRYVATVPGISTTEGHLDLSGDIIRSLAATADESLRGLVKRLVDGFKPGVDDCVIKLSLPESTDRA
jgi:hypothetical protein